MVTHQPAGSPSGGIPLAGHEPIFTGDSVAIVNTCDSSRPDPGSRGHVPPPPGLRRIEAAIPMARAMGYFLSSRGDSVRRGGRRRGSTTDYEQQVLGGMPMRSSMDRGASDLRQVHVSNWRDVASVGMRLQGRYCGTDALSMPTPERPASVGRPAVAWACHPAFIRFGESSQ